MAVVLGINAVFHDPAAALLVDGETVAAAEEERFTRRKHGKPPVAFSTWELPEHAIACCLSAGGVSAGDLDAVAYSYDPALAFQPNGDVTAAAWEGLRTLYARRAIHPVGDAGPAISLANQAGNADDVLMRALHGRRRRQRPGVPRGRRPRHLAIAAAGFVALGAAGARRPGAAAAGAAWALGTLELAAARIAPGPRTPAEVATMAWTSGALPFAAAAWWLHGVAGLPRALRAGGPRPWPAAVLLDRDGTLIEDVPYNGDPARVVPIAAAAGALARLREAGIPTAVVSNQSGIARGLLSDADVLAVHRRMAELLGPLGPLEYCSHGPRDGCACRKPRPGLVLRAADRLGVRAGDCAVIGDIGADVDAARAAGARAILVPTARTRAEEVAAAPERAGDLAQAVAMLLGEEAA
jgi:histidinol-phosphate phosphatase family protein